MKAVFGMLDIREGQVLMDGEDITSLSPQDRVLKGMGFVPQRQCLYLYDGRRKSENGRFYSQR